MAESLDVIEILAAFDPVGFSFMVESTTTMSVAGTRDMDPLSKEVMSEDVQSVAAFMDKPGLSKYDSQIRDIGESYGYVFTV